MGLRVGFPWLLCGCLGERHCSLLCLVYCRTHTRNFTPHCLFSVMKKLVGRYVKKMILSPKATVK